jgi:phosphomevalonate kinase
VIASAPGKLILTGEYAVLGGAPALVIAVNRRVIAQRRAGPRGSAPFLVAVADELASRFGGDNRSVQAALETEVDSSTLYDGELKLGLGSSAAVTVAVTARALAAEHRVVPVIDRELVFAIASAAHARAQAALGAAGSGADIAAAVHGGAIAFQRGRADRLTWPPGVVLLPFFTGIAAETPRLVAAVTAARERERAAVEAALAQVTAASRAACQACAVRAPEIAANALVQALVLAGRAIDQLAAATRIPLVPPCVTAARAALAPLGGTAKTTGAGGGDVAVAVIPATEDRNDARRLLVEAGCHPLDLSLDQTGVDLGPDPQ